MLYGTKHDYYLREILTKGVSIFSALYLGYNLRYIPILVFLATECFSFMNRVSFDVIDCDRL